MSGPNMNVTDGIKRTHIVALVAGIIFAVGLAIGGMTQPSKIVGFFDFSNGLESWDPSLAFVLGGGLVVYAPVYFFVKKRQRPLLAPNLYLPLSKQIDARLVIGSAIFGTGWGLGGFCPGPALTSLGTLDIRALVVAGAMLLGMFVAQRIDPKK